MISFIPFCPPALPVGANPDSAACEIQVVANDHQVFKFQFVKIESLANTFATGIHVGVRAEDCELFAAHRICFRQLAFEFYFWQPPRM